jgi:hypothetical protein
MKRILNLILFIFFIITITGCIQYTIPGETNRISNYVLTTDDFKIVGVVEAEGETRSIFFLTWGGNGFSAILKKAKEIGGDDIINYHYDLETTGVQNIIFSQRWTAHATVIKYTGRAIDTKLNTDNFDENPLSEKDGKTDVKKRKVVFGD